MYVDDAIVNHLSDTILYREAQLFVQQHRPPEQSQLTGLATFSRSWRELTDYVKHQVDRFQSNTGKQEHYGTFYQALYHYLDSKDGLRQRVRGNLQLLKPDTLPKQQEQEATTAWAQALAQEFIQHLVAEASLQARVGNKEA